jgi:hypothetical protein
MSISRWLNWTPAGPDEIKKNLEPEPPKPSKARFEGFAGCSPGDLPIMEQPKGISADASHPAKSMSSELEGVPSFPHCPRCASYALYRKDNIGNYECLTCKLQDIKEATARRVQ